MQPAECFSYLGQEVIESLMDLYLLHVSKLSKEKDYSRVIRELTVGGDRLVSGEGPGDNQERHLRAKVCGIFTGQENLIQPTGAESYPAGPRSGGRVRLFS